MTGKRSIPTAAPAAWTASIAILTPAAGPTFLIVSTTCVFALFLLVIATALFGSAARATRAIDVLRLLLRQPPDPRHREEAGGDSGSPHAG